MSIHKSLAINSGGTQHRNVLTRAERIAILQDKEEWEEGQSPLGIKKVRNIKPKKKAKTDSTASTDGEEGAATEATADAAAKDTKEKESSK